MEPSSVMINWNPYKLIRDKCLYFLIRGLARDVWTIVFVRVRLVDNSKSNRSRRLFRSQWSAVQPPAHKTFERHTSPKNVSFYCESRCIRHGRRPLLVSAFLAAVSHRVSSHSSRRTVFVVCVYRRYSYERRNAYILHGGSARSTDAAFSVVSLVFSNSNRKSDDNYDGCLVFVIYGTRPPLPTYSLSGTWRRRV